MRIILLAALMFAGVGLLSSCKKQDAGCPLPIPDPNYGVVPEDTACHGTWEWLYTMDCERYYDYNQQGNYVPFWRVVDTVYSGEEMPDKGVVSACTIRISDRCISVNIDESALEGCYNKWESSMDIHLDSSYVAVRAFYYWQSNTAHTGFRWYKRFTGTNTELVSHYAFPFSTTTYEESFDRRFENVFRKLE